MHGHHSVKTAQVRLHLEVAASYEALAHPNNVAGAQRVCIESRE